MINECRAAFVGVMCACSRREINYTTKRRFGNTAKQNVQLNYLHTAEMISVAVNDYTSTTHQNRDRVAMLARTQ